MNKVFSIIVASAVALFLIFVLIRIRYDRLVKQIWRSLKTPPTGLVFTPDMIADLDEPVQRYFLHTIAPGTPLASYVELKMKGNFRLQPDGDWLMMQASQIISPASGFVWQATIGKSLIKFSGADYYAQNRGRMKFSLWGLIPLVDAQNENINRSSVGRLSIEYIWLPSALLLATTGRSTFRGNLEITPTQNKVVWQVISKNTIQANFAVDNEPITLTLNIDKNGKLLSVSLPRWADKTEDSNWGYIPFGGKIQAEKTFDGYTVSSQLNVGYGAGTDKYQAFFQATIEQAKFY